MNICDLLARAAVAACFLIAAFAVPVSARAQPLSADPTSGRQLATKLCSSCHRVLPMILTDKADPPSFQSIADLPSTTGLSLNVFLHSNHKNMPNIILSQTESDDLIAYMLSLKKN